MPRCPSSIAYYGSGNKLTLPLNSLSEKFMVGRAEEVLQYRESTDPRVSQVTTKWRWRAHEAVEQVESHLRHKVLVGAVAICRAGLDSSPTTHYNKAEGKDRQGLVQKEVRAGVKELHESQMVGLRQQGAWTKWEQTVEGRITWSEMWKAEPFHINFLFKSLYDVLPSPTNLLRNTGIHPQQLS